MSRKNAIISVIALLIIGGLYAYVYRDYFRRPVMGIERTRERLTRRRAPGPVTPHPVFALDKDYRLTSIKVVPLAEYKANGHARVLWELASSAGSTPIKIFSYGSSIAGMHGVNSADTAEPLSNNVAYRLILQAGRTTGQDDFTLTDADYPDNAAP
jgi:hypothetical protein